VKLARPPKTGRRPLRVLLVEDSENDALLLLRELRRGGYEPEHERVQTPEAMRAALAEKGPWDVVVSDYRLPRFGAPEALAIFRESGLQAPFVVVSGKVGEDAAVEIMKAGAADFLTKDNLARLCATIERELAEAEERRHAGEELRRRDAILEAVRFAAERFLGNPTDRDRDMQEVLERLGRATETSRVYVFENHVGEDGGLWNRQLHKWVAPETPPGFFPVDEGGNLIRDFPYRDDGSGRWTDFGRWAEVLDRGEPMYGNVADFPEHERPFLGGTLGIRSMIIVPIFVEERWWGFIGFDDCVKEREWSAAEIDALKAAASTLGAALQRQIVEEELRSSETRYRAVIERATDGIYLLDADTRRVVESNPSYQNMLGYTAEELLGMEVYDFVAHPRENVDATIERTLRVRRRLVGERKYRRKDGSLLDVEVGVSVISLDGRDVICTIVRDITERKRSEEALAHSENRLRMIIETEPECVKVLGPDGSLLEMNPAGLSMIEADSLEQVRGKSVYGYIAPEHRSDFVALTEDVLRGGSGMLEFELVGLKGTRRWLETHAVPLRDAHAGIPGLLAITRDITERKRAEEDLRQSEKLYRTVIEEVSENICLVDVETARIVGSNPAFRETLGYSAEDLEEMTLYDIVAHDRESIEANMRRTAREGRTRIGERKYRRKDGSLVDVEAGGSIILRDGRETICVVAHDVTERARAQRLLEERVATLSTIAATLAFDLPTENILSVLAKSAVRASTAVACAVVLIDEETDELHLFGSHGLPEGYTNGLQEAYRAGVQSPSLRAYRTREPVLVRDVRRYLLSEPLYGPIHRFAREAPWDVTYHLPLISRGQALGTIFFFFLPDQEPAEDERAFLRAVADQTAVAVENARLLVEARGKAALEERQRLARELHDSVSQALYGIALGAKTARKLVDQSPGLVADPLDYVLSLAEAGLAEMRALIFELRPESLETEGLVAALQKQAAALRARHEIEVEAILCDEPEASPETKEALYRIAQEALHNTVKHARAGRVKVGMECSPGSVALEVSDDGVGFDVEEDFPGHLGLRSMRERAARLGGTLELESSAGAGTRVRARIPL
jgi:PAS domain S-box-containing protein